MRVLVRCGRPGTPGEHVRTRWVLGTYLCMRAETIQRTADSGRTASSLWLMLCVSVFPRFHSRSSRTRFTDYFSDQHSRLPLTERSSRLSSCVPGNQNGP